MSITINVDNLKNFESWMNLNLDSHILHPETTKEDKELLTDVKRLLGRSIFILYTSCNNNPEVHTDSALQFYYSIVSSIATGLEIESVMKKIEDGSTDTSDFVSKALTTITNPERYSLINKKIKDISIKLEEILGPCIQWWIKTELNESLGDTFKKYILEDIQNQNKEG